MFQGGGRHSKRCGGKFDSYRSCMTSIETIIDEYYDKLFHELCKLGGNDMDEFLIEVRLATDGKTIRRSWKDRDKMLKEREAGELPLDNDNIR